MNENNPLVHSFEAVSELKSRISRRDNFLIYRVNGRKLNDSISYVFKTSQALLELAVSMDKDRGSMLSREYAFFDGTFKRCPGYVTLACHVYIYIYIYRKKCWGTIVKIFTMETESESPECTELCWKLFNAATREFTGDENIVFNPCGWVQDEAAGFWNALRNVFGETAVKVDSP